MKSMEYYNSFGYRFTRPIKRLWFKFLLNQDKLIKVDDRHRGVGKTYMMIERAIKHDIPIIAGSQRHIDLIKRFGNPVDVYGLAPNFTIHVQGKRFPNGVMIDESVKPEMIDWLKGNNIRIRGGFVQNYGSGK
jgi:hypothetical protein